MNEFWINFFANFLSDIIVGVIIGTLLAIWIGKEISSYEIKQQKQAELRAETDKAIKYLQLIKGEIVDLLSKAPIDISVLSKGPGSAVIIPVVIWNVLYSGGELPRLIPPILLASIASFYNEIKIAQQAVDLTMQNWIGPYPNHDEKYRSLARKSIEQAINIGIALPEAIDIELKRLKGSGD